MFFIVLFHQSGWYMSANCSIFCCLVLANQVFSNQLCRGKIPRICCQGDMARDFVDIHLVSPGWDHLKPNHCFSKHQHQMQHLMDEPYVPILHYLMQREIFSLRVLLHICQIFYLLVDPSFRHDILVFIGYLLLVLIIYNRLTTDHRL